MRVGGDGSSSGGSARGDILVVDDIPMMRELMALFLSRAGRVIQAAEGNGALAIARRERPAVVIADLGLPGMDGAALCRAIREDPDLEATRVVILLPDGSVGDRVAAIRAGADDVLHKPLQRTDLLSTVSRFLAVPAVRGLPRVMVNAPVTIYLPERAVRARSVNLSRGGMFVKTDLELPERSEWRLQFQLPEASESISPTAMVVWHSEKDGPLGLGCGMRFLELDGSASRTVDDFVYERTPVSQQGYTGVPEIDA